MQNTELGKFDKNIDNGFFELSYAERGVFLSVYAPVRQGRRVTLDEVLCKLKEKNLKDFDVKSIEQAVTDCCSIPIKIADKQIEEIVDAQISLTMTPDKMSAYLKLIDHQSSGHISLDSVKQLIANSGIVYGIKWDTIENMVNYDVYNETICIAEGTNPVNAQNGKVQYMFERDIDTKPTVLEDGSVDFRELNLIHNVKENELLCILIPPVPGISGMNIVGSEIPAREGKPAFLPQGKNVKITEDGMGLVSTMCGQVSYEDGKVNVFSNYEVKADIDNSTGNISFVGNVIIRGNVLSGFSVEADGFVEVWGVVEGAVIKSGGDIILRRGMHGLGKGVLKSGRDIIAKYIEHSNVEAKNNICAEAIMHSNVKCGNKLELTGRTGLLVGGICKIGKEVSAKVIGSNMATATELEVGIDPSIKERYKQLKDEVASMENDVRKAEQAVNLLKKMEAAGVLSPEKQEMLARSVRTQIYYTNRIKEAREEILRIELVLQEDAQGKIRVNNYLYSGVKVTIGKSIMHVKETFQYCTLYRDRADIKIVPLRNF